MKPSTAFNPEAQMQSIQSVRPGAPSWKIALPCALLAAALMLALPSALAAQGEATSKAQVQKLVDVLKSKANQKEKADACRELASIADRDAIAALAALLPDESLSHMARYAMETIPDSGVDKAFRASLETLHGRPLVGVIGSIGVRHDAKAVKPLSRLLSDTEPDAAQAAARALGKIGTPAAAKALQKVLPAAPAGNQLAICEGLFRCAERLSANGAAKQAIQIYDSLRASQAGHQVRAAALRGAILAQGKDGLPLLVKALQSPDFAVFAVAVRTSLEMPGEAVTATLAGELPKAGADKQILLTQALGKRGDPAALPALTAAAGSGGGLVRVAAIRAIAELGNPSAVPVLAELTGASDREVAQAAQEALAGLPGPEADAAVLAMFRSADEGRRNLGMEMIARRRMASAIPELSAAASGPDAKLRVAAVRRISELGDARQIPALLELLSKAKTPEDLEAAENALSSIAVRGPDRDANARAVAGAIGAAQPDRKCALLRVLGAVGGATALNSIRTAVNDSSPEVRSAAIRTLGGWNSAEAAPDLLQLARSAADPKDKVLSLRSYLGLASQPELPADARLAMCREAAGLVQTPDETKLLLAALGTIRSVDTLPLILPHLEASSTRDEAAVACLTVAAKLLEGADASKNAAAVIEPLQKVAQVAANSDSARKAQGLIEKAQTKAAAK